MRNTAGNSREKIVANVERLLVENAQQEVLEWSGFFPQFQLVLFLKGIAGGYGELGIIQVNT